MKTQQEWKLLQADSKAVSWAGPTALQWVVRWAYPRAVRTVRCSEDWMAEWSVASTADLLDLLWAGLTVNYWAEQ